MSLQSLYEHLPAGMRTVAASLQGFYVSSQRYGRETESLVESALEREHWSRERWKTWQREQLARVLHTAATEVPFYREQWAARRRCGDASSWEDLENWPILEKEIVRQQPAAFLRDGTPAGRLRELHTSGSTGTPLKLWRSRATDRRWYALFEARVRRWNGVSRQDRWAILGGRLVTPFRQSEPPFWVWNAGMKQLYMSSYHLAPRNVPAYLSAMAKYGVRYLYGYASALYSLAAAALEAGRQTADLAVAISNAEPLFDFQRELIERAFRAPVRDTYGMTEIVAAGTECAEKHLHLWPEAGVLEIHRRPESVAGSNGTGPFVATGLLNDEMLLIRYETGDEGALAAESQSCACGRSLPILSTIEGRLDDVIVTADGRRVGRLDPVFKADLAIREAQVIQESLSRVRLRYVPGTGFRQSEAHTLAKRLCEYIGQMDVVLEPVDGIPRSANGKFRAVISEVNPRAI